MRTSRWLMVLALLALLSSLAFAKRRKNPRDFPNSVMCPIHLGWEVDLVGDIGVPDPTSQPRIHDDLKFVAAGPAAVVTFLACDRKSAIADDLSESDLIGDEIEVRIDDVAIVRESIFVKHQRAAVPDPDGCYFNDNPFPALSVGSVFDPALRPRVNPFTRNMPFFDSFSNLVASKKRWRLGGAEFDPVQGNLILARQSQADGKVSCASASFRAAGLVKGLSYVVDYKWSVSGIDNSGELAMLTYIDVGPGI